MACNHVDLGNGRHAIACGGPRQKRCSNCRRPAERLCDWRVGTKRNGKRQDCDAPICTICTTVPAPDKDLCRPHATRWGETMARAVDNQVPQGNLLQSPAVENPVEHTA